MTGLSRTALDRIAQMTLDEIDAMARDIGISVISIRLTETEMDRLLSLQGLQKAAYSISIAASARPRGGTGSFPTSNAMVLGNNFIKYVTSQRNPNN